MLSFSELAIFLHGLGSLVVVYLKISIFPSLDADDTWFERWKVR
jgi:hypothetical protein